MKHQKLDIRDSDIRAVLETIVHSSKIAVKINEPFAHSVDLSRKRMWDKIYSFDGLRVFVEAKLGIRKKQKNEKSTNYAVTPKQFAECREKMKIVGAPEGEALSLSFIPFFLTNPADIPAEHYIIGPLVDNSKDTWLKTIKVESILAQYNGEDLSEFGVEWEGFIDATKSKYGLEIKAMGNDVKEYASADPRGGLKMHEAPIQEKRIPFVFSSIISQKKDLEKICDVYHAGSAIQKAINDRTYELTRKYL